MGYYVSIERPQGPLTVEEWRAFVATRDDLVAEGDDAYAFARLAEHPDGGGFWLEDGQVCTKNPDELLLLAALDLATALGGRLIGDDGEIYDEADLGEVHDGGDLGASHAHVPTPVPEAPRPAAAPPARPGLLERTRIALRRLFARNDSGFHVGDRVRCIVRQAEGRVTAVRPGAVGGVLGTITVRFDDGAEVTQAFGAHSFERIP